VEGEEKKLGDSEGGFHPHSIRIPLFFNFSTSGAAQRYLPASDYARTKPLSIHGGGDEGRKGDIRGKKESPNKSWSEK